MFLNILVSLFVLFAVSRVWLRYRDGAIGVLGTIVWTTLWLGVIGFVWWPKITDMLAQKIGIGRGADALVYFSVVALFYGIFRLYVKMEFMEREITSLVREIALKSPSRSPAERDQPEAHP